jgi:integrase
MDLWECYLGVVAGGQKVRFTSCSEAGIKEKINDFYKKYAAVGDATIMLTREEIYDAKNAYEMMESAGLKMSLTKMAMMFIDGKACPVVAKVTLGEAYRAYVGSFDERQVEHIKSIKARVLPWVQHVGAEVNAGSIDPEDFVSYISGLKKEQKEDGKTSLVPVSKTTQSKTSDYIKSFLSWCVKKKMIDTSPLADVDKIILEYEEPTYSPVEDVRRLFDLLKQDGDKAMTAYAAMSFFCGMRACEIQRVAMDDKAIMLEDETIRIAKPKGHLQGIVPRVFRLRPNAKAWLEWAEADKTIRGRNVAKLRERMHKMMKEAGIPFPKNTGRHSFITYHVASINEPEKTAGLAGNSKEMVHDHYMGLATAKQGDEYFAIMP